MSTLNNERRTFLRRLRSEPNFLMRHVPALAAAIRRRITSRLLALQADAHRGRKLELASLPARRHPASRTCSERRGGVLPGYACAPQPARAPASSARVAAHGGDVEDVFLANRWSFLTSALIEGRVDAVAALAECLHWIDANKNKNDAVWEPYSAGERIANLLVFLAALPEATQASAMSALRDFTEESLDWIRGHVEYYGPRHTNNHILCNARALVLGGVATGNDEWIDAGIAIFRDWLPVLVSPGGFLRERSSHYQLVVLGWVLDALRFLQAHANRSEAAGFLESHASRMVAAAAWLCDAEGNLLAYIGDLSPDANPEQSSARLRVLYPESWPAPKSALRHATLADGWFKIRVANETVLGNFPSGAYPPPFPTHGHCDLTSFTWRHGVREILVDPGRYRYTPDEASMFQKSAAAHNVALVNGMAPVAETLVANGMWWPLPYSGARLTVSEYGGGIELAHDGFARATPVNRHRRRLVAQPGGLEVVDELDGEGAVELTFCWHFGREFERFDAGDFAAVGPRMRVRVGVDGLAARPSVHFANGAAPGGWTSRRYGDLQPSLCIYLRARTKLPTAITTRFAIHEQ